MAMITLIPILHSFFSSGLITKLPILMNSREKDSILKPQEQWRFTLLCDGSL